MCVCSRACVRVCVYARSCSQPSWIARLLSVSDIKFQLQGLLPLLGPAGKFKVPPHSIPHLLLDFLLVIFHMQDIKNNIEKHMLCSHLNDLLP